MHLYELDKIHIRLTGAVTKTLDSNCDSYCRWNDHILLVNQVPRLNNF